MCVWEGYSIYVNINLVTQDLHNHFLQDCLSRCPILTQTYSKQRQGVHSFIDDYFQSSQQETYFKSHNKFQSSFESVLPFCLLSSALSLSTPRPISKGAKKLSKWSFKKSWGDVGPGHRTALSRSFWRWRQGGRVLDLRVCFSRRSSKILTHETKLPPHRCSQPQARSGHR